MNIHEYQAKVILRNFRIQVPEGYVVYNNSTRYWAKRLDDGSDTVKVQIHALQSFPVARATPPARKRFLPSVA